MIEREVEKMTYVRRERWWGRGREKGKEQEKREEEEEETKSETRSNTRLVKKKQETHGNNEQSCY